MAEEGKMSRAMSKGGAGDRLSAEPRQAPPPPSPAVPPSAPEVAVANGDASPRLRRVRGRCGTPDRSVVMVHDKFGEVASQLRGLRSRILAMNNGKPPRVITITSASREEGKTTVTLNLSAALAELSEGRVAALDGDLVAPAMHLLGALDADTGLNEILDEGLSLDGNVYETAVPNLDLIPARAIDEENAYEGALGQNCGALLKKLRRSYSYVVIDTPPVLAASQACTFARHSDGVLVLARLEKTPRDVVRRALEELVHSGATVLGCVLTHRKHHIPDFVYRFFGSTPHYYYSYGRSRDQSSKNGT